MDIYSSFQEMRAMFSTNSVLAGFKLLIVAMKYGKENNRNLFILR